MMKRNRKDIVLVIEDEVDVRKFASRVLTLEGFTVLETDNGEQGLKLVRKNKCALVLLDLRLPGRDGWFVLKKMKEDPALRDVPVIVFTASAGIPQRERALHMGAVDYLIKPLSAAAIRDSIARAMKPQDSGI